MEDITSFGYWLRRRPKALDLTREELGRLVGCAADTIKKIESDARRPSRQLAERLAAALDIPADEQPSFLKAARAELRAAALPSLTIFQGIHRILRGEDAATVVPQLAAQLKQIVTMQQL